MQARDRRPPGAAAGKGSEMGWTAKVLKWWLAQEKYEAQQLHGELLGVTV